MINKFDICKHFKGKNLVEKNIYGILEVKMTYTGENESFPEVAIYKPLFFNGKCFIKEFLYLSGKIQYDKSLDLDAFNNVTCFIREYKDLISEIDSNKQIEFNQKRRVEPLNEKELDEILSDEFIKEKIDYMNKKTKSL